MMLLQHHIRPENGDNYCGDKSQNDVEGSFQVGIFPIWYDNLIDKIIV